MTQLNRRSILKAVLGGAASLLGLPLARLSPAAAPKATGRVFAELPAAGVLAKGNLDTVIPWPTTPEGMMRMADWLAHTGLGLSWEDRTKWLTELKQANPLLHTLTAQRSRMLQARAEG
jgi:hypothetical protein